MAICCKPQDFSITQSSLWQSTGLVEVGEGTNDRPKGHSTLPLPVSALTPTCISGLSEMRINKCSSLTSQKSFVARGNVTSLEYDRLNPFKLHNVHPHTPFQKDLMTADVFMCPSTCDWLLQLDQFNIGNEGVPSAECPMSKPLQQNYLSWWTHKAAHVIKNCANGDRDIQRQTHTPVRHNIPGRHTHKGNNLPTHIPIRHTHTTHTQHCREVLITFVWVACWRQVKGHRKWGGRNCGRKLVPLHRKWGHILKDSREHVHVRTHTQ